MEEIFQGVSYIGRRFLQCINYRKIFPTSQTGVSNMEYHIYIGLGLSQKTESPKVRAKLSKPLEKVYLVLPFSINLLRFEVETNLFASLITSHPTLWAASRGSILSQSSSTQVQILTIAKALLYRLKIFVWKAHTPKEILNDIWKICSKILLEYWNIRHESLWAVSRPPHSAFEDWTRNFEVRGARMNRFDSNCTLVGSHKNTICCHPGKSIEIG